MFKRLSAALAFACVIAGPSHASTLGFGVEVDPYPVLSSSGPTNWVTDVGFTRFGMLLNDESLGNIRTSATTKLDVEKVNGVLGVNFNSAGLTTGIDPSSLTLSLDRLIEVPPLIIGGPTVILAFPQELVAVVTAVEFDLNPAAPKIKFLMDVSALGTTAFFKDLFGQKLFGQIELDPVDIGPFEPSELFDIEKSGVTGFFSMYRVTATTGGGDGDGGSGGGDISPIPLPASVPLLLAALGSLALVRRKT